MQHRIPSHDVIKKGHGEPSGHATPRREPIPSKSLGAGEVKAGTPLLTVHPDGESARHTAASTPLPSPAIYKILVYNASKKKVTSAIATSTFAVNTLSGSKAEEVLSPAEIFPRLRSPAKFLRHVGLLRDDGFEMVSGQGDVLVFKKVSTGTSTQALSGDERERPGSRPAVLTQSIDGAQPTDRSASTASRETFDTLGRRNSDTSWRAVRYCDLPEEHAANQGATTESTAVPAPQHSAESGASSGRQQHFIKREEDVFSGQKLHKPRAGQRPQHESEQPAPAEEKETGGRLSRWLGRIASFAADAAYLVGCLYLTGYLIEYFRVLPA
ncbi:MAG: hypothetical protein M1826_003260 [Phylliscum demangeonii]|nr:MAG: hypothetical protein M1826_003260 [Phylliscum demangeonii]